MTVVKKTLATPKAKVTKPKVAPKPKFGELGYEFHIKAKIVEVHPEEDQFNYPFVVEVQLGDYEDFDAQGDGSYNLHYETREDLENVVSKTVPSLLKTIKTDELNKAKAEVARLTKELAAIK